MCDATEGAKHEDKFKEFVHNLGYTIQWTEEIRPKSFQEILDKVLKKLSDDTFIELENEITNQYKVLASFKYLEQLILTINIPEEVSNEIPE